MSMAAAVVMRRPGSCRKELTDVNIVTMAPTHSAEGASCRTKSRIGLPSAQRSARRKKGTGKIGGSWCSAKGTERKRKELEPRQKADKFIVAADSKGKRPKSLVMLCEIPPTANKPPA